MTPLHRNPREKAELKALRARVTELEEKVLAAQAENERLRTEASDLTDSLESCRNNVEREQADHQATKARLPVTPHRLDRGHYRPTTDIPLPRKGDS